MTKLSKELKNTTGGLAISWTAITFGIIAVQMIVNTVIGIVESTQKVEKVKSLPPKEEPPEQINYSKSLAGPRVLFH